MFWYCCDSLKFGSKRDIKQIIKSNSIENDERFASIFTYNSERNYGGNRYNTAFDWGSTNQFSQLPSFEEQFPTDQNANKFGEFVCTLLSLLFFVITLPISLFFALKFVNPFQKAVVMRLGKCQNKVHGQGMILLLPFIDEATIVDLRVSTIELPTIYLFTTDRGIVELSSVVLIQVTDPIIACCTVQNVKQAELDQFVQKYGVKIDAINITKINVIKTGENGAVSIFKTLIRSDVGKQFLDVFGCPNNMRDFIVDGEGKEKTKMKLADESKKVVDTFSTASTEKQNSPSTLNSISEERVEDTELENLLQRIRLTLFQNGGSLLKRVDKCFRVKCTDCPSEFDIDLRESCGGWCGWTWQREDFSLFPDVHFTLAKTTIISLINGQLSPMSAYINGLVQIRGSIQDAILLKNLADCLAVY
uniref:PHB domain-containing protein n=1 Tax=Meloidogyne hapla TaxID=6305 RepID=A0A1I8BAY8_MELHA